MSRQTDAARALFLDAAGVLSDMDGTLVDSTGSMRRSWTGFALAHGLDPARVITHAHGRPARETIADLLPHGDQVAEVAALERAEIEDTEGVIALPGALAVLRDHPAVAIVTSAGAALARVRLAAADLPLPPVLISVDDVVRGKPDPEPFLAGAAALGLDASRCVVLEDAPAGITAGRRAGARVIAVRTTHGDGELVEADAIIDDLSELGGIIPRG